MVGGPRAPPGYHHAAVVVAIRRDEVGRLSGEKPGAGLVEEDACPAEAVWMAWTGFVESLKLKEMKSI